MRGFAGERMRLACLLCNNDRSDFAARHPDDAARFAALIGLARPDWRVDAFVAHAGELPSRVEAYDGLIVTGSVASANDPDPWIAALFATLRTACDRAVPMFGACFGHQAIATALGGQVGPSPGGWTLGLERPHIADPLPWMDRGTVALYAAHGEQVLRPPPGARVLGGTAGCPVGFYTVGQSIFATQYHPEMPEAFFADLVAHLGEVLSPDLAARARATLTAPPDAARFATWITAFFEAAPR